MPYEWHEIDAEAPAVSGASAHSGIGYRLTLWPYRSLPRRGFVIFIAATAMMFLAPLMAVLGTATLWVLLPFMAGAIAVIWWALQRSYRDGEVLEELTLTRHRITLTHRQKGKPAREWEANPFWVRVTLYPGDRPVPHYLTLKGNDREVELGAFLSEEERVSLSADLKDRLARINTHPEDSD